jgi:hypothetical protein
MVLSPFPNGLFNGNYWSATLSSSGFHELVQIYNNTSAATSDSSTNSPVVVQVLPVVIDLNRDGVLNYGQVTMDVNGDGYLDTTKWAGAQDGVLVWDKYADGLVHDNSQYAFAQYATTYANGLDANGKAPTDLSGLAEAFDSNHDGVFSAADAKFAEFKVWQDANQNGISDAGEVRGLLDWGIVSINLSSDNIVRTPTAGVIEAGRTTATVTDGTQLLVSDAAFDYQAGAVQGSNGVFQLTGTGMSIDLDKLEAAVGQVSELDLGSGHNTLSLSLSDVLTQPLTVNGVTGDALELFTAGEFVTATSAQLNGQTYQAYDLNRDGQLDLLVQQAVVVNMH